MFQELYNLPKNSIYALVNDQDKEVFLTYSSNTFSSLSRLIGELRSGVGLVLKPDRFEFKLLEVLDQKDKLKLRFNKWYDGYRNSGYKFLNKRKPVSYKLVAYIDSDFRNRTKKLLYVGLKNRSNIIVVGTFDNIEDSETFMKSYGPIDTLKYASNKLTVEFLNVSES